MDESGENFLVGKIACPYFDVLTKVGFPLASCDFNSDEFNAERCDLCQI